MSFNSKYTGQQVEALLDIVSQGGGTGGEGGEVQKTTETEIIAMGFTKNQGTITEVKMNGVSKGTSGVVDLGTVITEHQDISGKVDKVAGKQLSTEDFTTALKQKLEGLSNYNDAEIEAAVSSLQTQLNTLVSGNANDAINSFNEIIAFLNGVKDSQDLSSIIASIEQQIASKQDKLVSGTNIKTINGQSILGSGNITIEGGGGGSSSGGESSSKEIVQVYGGNITLLEPNKIYIYESEDLIFNIESIEEPIEDYAEYSVIFVSVTTSGNNSVIPTIILPEEVTWANGVIPDITAAGIYEMSIVYWFSTNNGGYNAVLTRFGSII